MAYDMRQRICLVLAAALAAVVSETERRPNNCTDLIDANAPKRNFTPVDLEAVTVGGVARELWLVWTGDADRVAAALLLRVLGALKRCQKQRCRLRLCYMPQGLCDLLAKKGTDVVGIETAITVGFETNSGCPTKRFFNFVGKSSQLQSREAPAKCAKPHQLQGLQPPEPLQLATELDLTYHAPWLKRAMEKYEPTTDVLCALLRTETPRPLSSAAAIDAVDQWTVTEPELFRNMVRNITAEGTLYAETYQALVYRCDGNGTDDWTEPGFDAAYEMFGSAIQYETQPKLVVVRFPSYLVDCSSPSEIAEDLHIQLEAKNAYRLLGAVVAGAGVPDAADLAARRGLVLISYDTQPRHSGTPSTAPDAAATGVALRALLARCGWRRAVLLSQDTPASRTAAEAFGSEKQVGQMTLPASDAVLNDTLVALSEAGQRVFVLNADGVAAARTLAVAAGAGLTPSEGYAWIAREWTSPLPPPLALLALAPAPQDAEWLETVSKLWPKRPPPRAAPLLSAMRMLALGYAKVFERHETWRFDHRLVPVRKSFLQIVHPVEHKLTLEVWLPNETEPRLDDGTCPRFDVLDGASSCWLLVGNPFNLTCVDGLVCLGAVAVLAHLVVVRHCLVTARRRARARKAARDRDLRSEILVQLVERQPGTHARLKELVVHRERVTLLRELGAGRHGRVSLAALAPTGTHVAAKMPHSPSGPAEEGELIREAATLAPLRHQHVVRLLGVCLGPGQPLLLTPVARHGDLLSYLRARRPPVEASEAAHVSAQALTRLAREAALALAYLQHRGVVHCDVRAANCLVDERRELKLADFGMARSLSRSGAGAGAGAGVEYYACRRRALFPVLWMAPESLARGAFSAASDVWALGVLSLELVTLGARPFGALGAAEAVALVSRGGHARLPSRATPETRDLTRQCWRHSAPERPSARELAVWLASHPVALAPVPPTGRADHDDSAAFGEAPCESTFSIENSPDS